MQMPKPTEADKELFRSVVPDAPGVEVKPMFGNLGAFVNGNMFAGLFGPSIGVKLAADDRAELAAVEGAGPFGPAERPMGGYLSLPAVLHHGAGGRVGRQGAGVHRDAAAQAQEAVGAAVGGQLRQCLPAARYQALAEVGRRWLRMRMAREDMPPQFCSDTHRDGE